MKTPRTPLCTILAACAVTILAAGALLGVTHPVFAAKPAPPTPPPPLDPHVAIVYNAGADLRVMNADGTGDRLVLAAAGGTFTYFKPRWSPDPVHRQIVFSGTPPASAGGVGTGVYTIEPDGSNLYYVTSCRPDGNPAWSPGPLNDTGYWILFTDSGPATPSGSAQRDIFAVRPDGTGRINLTNTLDISELESTWSPLGDRFAVKAIPLDGSPSAIVVYTLNEVNGAPQIATVPAPWTTSASGLGYCRDWARTQSKVLYNPAGFDRRLCTVDVDTDVVELVTAPVWDATWSPDDTRIAYQEYGGNLYVMNVTDGSRTIIKSLAKRNATVGPVQLDWRRYLLPDEMPAP